MYSGDHAVPCLFAWVIPSGHGTHRIGIWIRGQDLEEKSVEHYYHNLINHPLWKEKFQEIKEIGRYCGPVPCGIIKKPYANRVLLIGDAAGSAKPTTGGVYWTRIQTSRRFDSETPSSSGNEPTGRKAIKKDITDFQID